MSRTSWRRHGVSPELGRVCMLRQWGGIMDMTMNGSPIIDRIPVEGLYLNYRLVLWRLQGDAGFRMGKRI